MFYEICQLDLNELLVYLGIKVFITEFNFVLVLTEEEDLTSVLRDKSHIDETLRLATEEKSADYAGE